ncbi:regulatory protein RecX [Sphingomonas sp. FW199]|uniref:regulatory protein RecX n=1 Tax=Sphingomonas sp. FW199 TaxID=3400217 RepID=UPI003CEE4F5C
MDRSNPNRPPLDHAALERLALRYVERFATSRGRLLAYLERKLFERGTVEGPRPDAGSIADRMVMLGYVDDRAYADARSRALSRRGMGGRRIDMALRQAGIDEPLRQETIDSTDSSAEQRALRYAERRRFGPFSRALADPDQQRRQVAAMVRAGHAPALSARIVRMKPGDDALEPVDNA